MERGTVPPEVEVRPSPIAGEGAFAMRVIWRGHVFNCGVPFHAFHRVELGSPDWDSPSVILTREGHLEGHPGWWGWQDKLNHSDEPNCTYDTDSGDLMALRDIDGDEELTIDYRRWVHPEDRAYKAVFGG